MIVVTGAPRSGTSLMMQILRESLGPDRIVGTAQPCEWSNWREDSKASRPGATDADVDRWAKNMLEDCPGGYWEAPWVMKGLPDGESYPSGYACKLVGEGLARTDPQHVDRVIYMLRDPRQAATSQARTRGRLGGVGGIKHQSFVEPTLVACRFLAKHQPPTLVVELDDLRSMPEFTLGRVRSFLETPIAFNGIKPRDRGATGPITDHGGWWDVAYEMYRCVTHRDWRGASEAYERKRNAEAVEAARSDPDFADVILGGHL